MKLREAILTAPRTIEYREREIPPLTGSQVLVRVTMCGVCSSEIAVYLGKTQGAPGASFRYWKYPSSLGHECSGVVADVGPDIRRGHFHDVLGVGSEVTGICYSASGFATHVIEDIENWVVIPDGFKPEEVLGEPLACVENIKNAIEDTDASNLLMIGDGFMSMVLCSRLDYAIVVVGHHDYRLSKFKLPKGIVTINSNTIDPYHEAKTWWPNYTMALDFTGKMAGLQLAASLCKPKNRTPLLMCGVYDNEPFTLGHYMVNRGVVPIPCHPAQSTDFCRDLRNGVTPETIRQSRELITHSYKLEELDKAFEDSMGRRDGFIKGVVCPNY